MKTRAIAALALLAAASFDAFAGTTSDFLKQVKAYNATVVENSWYCNLSKAKAYAEKNKMPLVVVWSNGDACGHCVQWEKACNTSAFKNYVKSSGIVWVFGWTKDGHDGALNSGSIYKYTFKNQTQFPLIRIVWAAGKVDYYTKGDDLTGGGGDTAAANNAIKKIKSKLSKYKYVPAASTPTEKPYLGAQFGVADAPQARLEVEPDVTRFVWLPLVRTNSTAQANAATNTVVSLFPSGVSVTNRIEWAAGGDSEVSTTGASDGESTNIVKHVSGASKDNEIWFEYDTTSLTNAGDKIEISIYNSTNGTLGAKMETTHITAAESENSPKNPYWIGEKTADTLGWGEWTMDIDVATNKVRTANNTVSFGAPAGGGEAPAKAYTLALVGGSMWCPDCAAADLNFFDREEFRDWAKSNKVALVAIDIPNPGKNDFSLLSYGINNTSERYWTCNYTPGYTNEDLKVQSGSCYISRHMISTDDAERIAQRNLDIVGTDTLNGGWNRPESTNKLRTGVPHLVVLRDDGTIAARFNRYSDVGPKAYEPGMFERFKEMFAQIDDPLEESNDSYTTTTEAIGMRDEAADRTISFIDRQDVYLIDPDTTLGKEIEFTVEGAVDAEAEIKIVSSTGTLVASASGSLKDGISLAQEISDANWFVSVGVLDNAGYPVSPYFAHTSESTTVAAYTLKTDFVVIPTETKGEDTVPDENLSMTFSLVADETYRITNLDPAANAAHLAPVEGSPDFYKALETGCFALALAGKTVEHQLWRPGKIGFEAGSAFVPESSGEYSIKLVRTGGVSGEARATVTFDTGKSSTLAELFEIPEGLGEEFVWADGDAHETNIVVKIVDNDYSDGDQKLYFDVAVSGNAEPGISQFCLTVRDNDKKAPGRLAIVAADPAIAGSMKAYVRAGESIAVSLGRENGVDGPLSATLSASAGTLDETAFKWDGREKAVKTAVLDLSGVAKGKTAKLTLVPAKGTSVDTKRRILTIETVDAEAPGFEEPAVAFDAWRYVAMDDVEIALDEHADSSTTVKLLSGSLPSGVKWKYDKAAQKVVLSGLPTKAGVFTASFRATSGKKAGTTCTVTGTVVDPVVAGGAQAPGSSKAAPLNASVAASRTFSDVALVDAGAKRLAGVLTLTLPRTGKASAKCRMADGSTVSLSSANWNGVAADGALSATLSRKAGDWTLDVEAKADGTVAGTLADAASGASYEVSLGGNVWSKKNTAADFKGYYTASLPAKTIAGGNPLATGAGYATVKLTAASALQTGKATVAGALPDGKAFSASVVLTAADWKEGDPAVNGGKGFWSRGLLPILVSNAEGSLSGIMQLTPGAADPDAMDVDPTGNYATGRAYYMQIRRSIRPAEECETVFAAKGKTDALSSEIVLDVFGGYYDQNEDFADCCETVFGKTTLTLFALDGFNYAGGGLLDRLSAGACTVEGDKAVTSVTVKYAKATSKAKTKTNQLSSGDKKLSFALSTGIVSGTFALPFEGGSKTVTYAAVLKPRWGSQECGDCGIGGAEAALDPFISGMAWFTDVCEYEDANGKTRTVKVRRSCRITVGVNAGE